VVGGGGCREKEPPRGGGGSEEARRRGGRERRRGSREGEVVWLEESVAEEGVDKGGYGRGCEIRYKVGKMADNLPLDYSCPHPSLDDSTSSPASSSGLCTG